MLVTVREWSNSFIPIRRIPLEILSLIAAHLFSQKQRHCASFVCRYWRRTFHPCDELLSELSLSMWKVMQRLCSNA
jgi:hypothetical protein